MCIWGIYAFFFWEKNSSDLKNQQTKAYSTHNLHSLKLPGKRIEKGDQLFLQNWYVNFHCADAAVPLWHAIMGIDAGPMSEMTWNKATYE